MNTRIFLIQCIDIVLKRANINKEEVKNFSTGEMYGFIDEVYDLVEEMDKDFHDVISYSYFKNKVVDIIRGNQ